MASPDLRPSCWAEMAAEAKTLFGIDLTDAQLDRLEIHARLVREWSAKLNLVSVGSLDELVFRHVLDSLAPAALLRPGDRFADVGSGAGFPGVPVAVVHAPGGWLLESRRRRATFLRHAIRTLALDNLRVFDGRAEDFAAETDGKVEVVIGRAIRDEVLAGLAVPILRASGRLVVMRKAGAGGRGALPGFAEIGRKTYALPGGPRHEAILFERCFT